MQRIDVLIVAALLLAVAGSAVGVLTYTDERAAAFDVEWRILEETLTSEPATATAGATAEVPLFVETRNLTSAEVAVAITPRAPNVQPVAVHIEVTIPGENETYTTDGNLLPGPGAQTFTLPIPFADVPEVASLRAASPDAARATLAALYGSARGIGNWTVTVSVAPTAPDPLGAQPYAIDVTALLATYSAEVAVQLPEGGR